MAVTVRLALPTAAPCVYLTTTVPGPVVNTCPSTLTVPGPETMLHAPAAGMMSPFWSRTTTPATEGCVSITEFGVRVTTAVVATEATEVAMKLPTPEADPCVYCTMIGPGPMGVITPEGLIVPGPLLTDQDPAFTITFPFWSRTTAVAVGLDATAPVVGVTVTVTVVGTGVTTTGGVTVMSANPDTAPSVYVTRTEPVPVGVTRPEPFTVAGPVTDHDPDRGHGPPYWSYAMAVA